MKGHHQEYNKLLDAFDAKHHRYSECISFLLEKGYSLSQSKNALYVYKKGGKTSVETRRTSSEWNRLLREFNASKKTFDECVRFLMNKHEATFPQAKEAVINYKKK